MLPLPALPGDLSRLGSPTTSTLPASAPPLVDSFHLATARSRARDPDASSVGVARRPNGSAPSRPLSGAQSSLATETPTIGGLHPPDGATQPWGFVGCRGKVALRGTPPRAHNTPCFCMGARWWKAEHPLAREETLGPLWRLSEETWQHHGILAFMRECMCVGGGGGVRVVWR